MDAYITKKLGYTPPNIGELRHLSKAKIDSLLFAQRQRSDYGGVLDGRRNLQRRKFYSQDKLWTKPDTPAKRDSNAGSFAAGSVGYAPTLKDRRAVLQKLLMKK